MGYGESKCKFSPPLRLAAERHARGAVRADDLNKVARFPIFTKQLFRQLSPPGGSQCAGRSEPSTYQP